MKLMLCYRMRELHKMRRLPIYLLIDTSGSMKGEPIESVKIGLETMQRTLLDDPVMSDFSFISIITFDKKVKNVLPLTSIRNAVIPELVPPNSGPTFLGAAIELLLQKIDTELEKRTITNEGDYPPIVLIMTDGKPSDIALYESMCERLRKRKVSKLIACAVGPLASEDSLKLITSNVVNLCTLDSFSFIKLFDMVCSKFDTNQEYDVENMDVLPSQICL